MAILLSEYANEPIDVLKTVTMLLIHDIVEIDAGDTYAYHVSPIKPLKSFLLHIFWDHTYTNRKKDVTVRIFLLIICQLPTGDGV